MCGCYVCSLLLSHLHCSNVDHSAVKLFEDFSKHAKHVDAVERYSGGREVKVKNPAMCCVCVCFMCCRVSQWVQEVVGELAGVSGGVRWQPDPTGMVSKGRIVLQQDVGSGKTDT